ncbi:MAG: KH domain-containing protein [Candidatus Micrarchaeia archaeon]
MQEIYIPEERAKLLNKSKLLEKIEESIECKIEINDNVIKISGNAYQEFLAKNVITAFGRGFSEEESLNLLDDNYYLSIIDLKLAFDSEKRIKQVKARVIGTNGKTKKYIENVSKTSISVYGNTIGIIGEYEDVQNAETAVKALINGDSHKLAYIKMEREKQKSKENR